MLFVLKIGLAAYSAAFQVQLRLAFLHLLAFFSCILCIQHLFSLVYCSAVAQNLVFYISLIGFLSDVLDGVHLRQPHPVVIS